MSGIVYVLWFLVSTSDAIAAVLMAAYFIRIKRRFGRYMAAMVIGIAVEAVIAAGSLLLFWQSEVYVMPAFAISRVIGRTIKATVAWIFLAYLFYWIAPDDPTRTDDQTRTRIPD